MLKKEKKLVSGKEKGGINEKAERVRERENIKESDSHLRESIETQ